MLYGDTASVLRDGSDILELIGEEQKDTRGECGVRNYNIGDDPAVDGVYTPEVCPITFLLNTL